MATEVNNISFKNRNIIASETLLNALKKMDHIDRKLLIVVDGDAFHGLVSAGDIQRAIIRNKPLETLIKEVIRENIRVANESDSFEKVKQLMLEFRMELCPVVSSEGKLIKVYFWEEIFGSHQPQSKKSLGLPIVIMAGGIGSRLKPLTNVLPKPLIPIGDNTMLEEIMNRFHAYGCNDFYISVNYKSELIEFYINQLQLNYNIFFFKEDKPLGTAGSLSLLKGKIDKTFIVNNCDILIEQDLSEILDYHKEHNNEITIVAALKSFHVPYGTIKATEGGELTEMIEKPSFNYWINTGMYLLEPSVFGDIPHDEVFHLTHLIENLKKQGRRVGVFPVSEGSWLDTGEWDEYNRTQDKIASKKTSL